MFEQQLNRAPAWMRTAAFFAALAGIMVLSPLQWTTSEGVPITLQSLLVILVPAILGWKAGTAVVLVYLLAGGLGAPVFAYGTSGWERFTGSTGGFLLAFPLAAILSGWAMQLRTKSMLIVATFILFAGQLLILALGLGVAKATMAPEGFGLLALASLGPVRSSGWRQRLVSP